MPRCRWWLDVILTVEEKRISELVVVASYDLKSADDCKVSTCGSGGSR
jgi:hypothetical protein